MTEGISAAAFAVLYAAVSITNDSPISSQLPRFYDGKCSGRMVVEGPIMRRSRTVSWSQASDCVSTRHKLIDLSPTSLFEAGYPSHVKSPFISSRVRPEFLAE